MDLRSLSRQGVVWSTSYMKVKGSRQVPWWEKGESKLKPERKVSWTAPLPPRCVSQSHKVHLLSFSGTGGILRRLFGHDPSLPQMSPAIYLYLKVYSSSVVRCATVMLESLRKWMQS